MKHKLLITAASLMFALTASAQWTKPTVTNFVDMAEDGETTQYLYNVGVNKFFCGHNEWNTRASVDEYGEPIRISKMEGEEGYYDIGVYPSKYRTDINAWKSLSGNSWDGMWCDGDPANTGTYQGCQMWLITKIGDIYKFSNDNFNQAYEFGPTEATLGVGDYVMGEAGNTRCYLYYQHTETITKHMEDGDEDVEEDAFQGNFYDEWKFVSEETYNEYVENIDKFNAATSLKKAIDEAKAENPGIDLSAQETVYNNTSSTLEELQAAEKSVGDAVVEYKMNEATPDNPVNFTAKIVNPNFGPEGSTPDFTGWLGTTFGAGGTTWSNAEHYGKTFDSYQDIEGLPEGVYMVACNGYTRYQNAQADYNAWKAGTPAETKIYLKSETTGTFSTPVHHVSAGGSIDAPIGTNGTTTVTYTDEEGEHTLYCPNLMITANDYFHDGTNRYRNEAYGGLAGGDVLRLGLINEKATGSDWSIFDDFELWYFGNSDAAYQLWGSKIAEKNVIAFNEHYGAPDKAVYDAAINTLKNATNKDAIMQAIQEFETIPDQIALSQKNYKLYLQELDKAMDELTNLENQGADPDITMELSDYLQASAEDNGDLEWGYPNGCANYIIDLENGAIEGRLSAEEIAEETAWLHAKVSEVIEKCMDAGFDVSNLLVNPKFTDGFNGWTNSDGGAVVGNVGGLEIFPVVECYETVVDVQQTVNAKPGVYAISVYAFERPGGNTQFSGDEDLKVRLYMNQFSTPVQHIVKDAIPDEECQEQVNCYRGELTGGWPYDYNVEAFGWIPNSVDGASYAFNSGRYLQTCYGLVGEDGVMKIGLTSDGVKLSSGGWCLWAGFSLKYMAKDEDALSSVIEYYANLAGEISDPAGKPDLKALNDAVEAAQAATDGETMYTELFKMIDAYNAVLESVKSYEKALAAYDNLMAAATDYAETASPEALAAAEGLLGDYSGIEDYNYAGTELDPMIEEMEKATSRLKIPDYSNPPTDFTAVIDNPSFETGDLSGWEYYQGNDTGSKDISNATYTVENADGQYVFNTWSGSAPAEGFWVQQKLRALPTGTYKLEALLASDAGNKITLSANDVSQEYTMENPKELGQDGEITFTLAEEGDVVIKAWSASWFKCDNFRLTYGVEGGLKGDVNGDNDVNISDVVAIINTMAGDTTFAGTSDVNGDGDTNISDVVKVINIMAGTDE
jgi:hypothetical protein